MTEQVVNSPTPIHWFWSNLLNLSLPRGKYPIPSPFTSQHTVCPWLAEDRGHTLSHKWHTQYISIKYDCGIVRPSDIHYNMVTFYTRRLTRNGTRRLHWTKTTGKKTPNTEHTGSQSKRHVWVIMEILRCAYFYKHSVSFLIPAVRGHSLDIPVL